MKKFIYDFVGNMGRNDQLTARTKKVLKIFTGTDIDEDPHWIRHYITTMIVCEGLAAIEECLLTGIIGGMNPEFVKKFKVSRGDKFPAFIALVGLNMAAGSAIAQPINDYVDFLDDLVNTGRLTRLYNKGWTDEMIADHLKMDIDTVKSILHPVTDESETQLSVVTDEE